MLLALGASLLSEAPVRAQDPGTDSLHAAETVVFRRLQRAMAANDRQAAAAEFVFPFQVNRTVRSHVTISSRQELLRRFDRIVTPQIRKAILSQQPDSLFQNWQGSMVGDGEVWISGVSDRSSKHCRLGVTAINLPPSSRQHARVGALE